MPATKQGFTYRASRDAHLEELAAAVRMRSSYISPGVGFARKEEDAAIYTSSEKSIARRRVIDAFSKIDPNMGRKFRLLSLPGIFWKFERALCGMRGCDLFAVEMDAAIFRASIRYMPGYCHKEGFMMPDNATVISKFVWEYKLMSVDRYLQIAEHRWDAAWLDYTGFITPTKLRSIREAWQRVDYALAVTLLDARQAKGETAKIVEHGGLAEWLSYEVGQAPADVYRYTDGVPMTQIIWRRPDAQA